MPIPQGATVGDIPIPEGAEIRDEEQKPKPEGFWHSAASVFGLTPEQRVAANQEVGQHPWRSLAEHFPGPGAAVEGMVRSAFTAGPKMVKKAYGEAGAANDALGRKDIPGFLAHEIGGVGYTGAAVASPVLGESPAKAGEQFGEGNVKGGIGTTAATIAPFLIPGARDIPAKKLARSAMAVNEGIPVLNRFNRLSEVPGKLKDIWGSKPTGASVGTNVGTESGPVPTGEAPVTAPYRLRGNQIQDAATITPRQVFKPKGLLGTGQPTEAAIPPVKAQPKGEVPVQSTWPPERPSAIQPLKFGGAQDRLETKGIQEQMREDLEGHGRQALSQEKRDWFARNVPGETKGTLTANARAQKTIATRPNGEVPVEGKPVTPAVEERGIKAPQKRTFERSTDQGIKDYFSYRFDQLRSELKSAQAAGNQTAISDVQRRMNELDSIQRNPGQMKATLTGEVPAEPPTTDWSVENMKKQIEKNKKTRTAKAGD